MFCVGYDNPFKALYACKVSSEHFPDIETGLETVLS
jgi:hypothetical protein